VKDRYAKYATEAADRAFNDTIGKDGAGMACPSRGRRPPGRLGVVGRCVFALAE
jgi:hypothetical protein